MPATKISKEKIIETACSIVREEGLDALNARRLARELGGSTQLIYHNFAAMDELIEAVIAEINKYCEQYMELIVDLDHPYLAKGMSYVSFAREYPEYFKILFMSESKNTLDEFMRGTRLTERTVATIGKVFPMEKQDYLAFHKKIWIFTHGIACLVATKTIKLTDDEVRKLLTTTTRELYQGRRSENGASMVRTLG